jgi:hypothetical protein
MGWIEENACMMTIIRRNDNTQRVSNHHKIRSGAVGGGDKPKTISQRLKPVSQECMFRDQHTVTLRSCLVDNASSEPII